MGVLSIHLRTYAHATESREKVVKALMELLPEDLRSSVSPSIEVYEGYYGNPIEVITVDVNDPRLTTRILEYIVSRLSDMDRRRLLATLEDRVDRNGDLYLRFNKQEAFRGSIALEEGDDVVRVHVRFSGGRREALKYYGSILSK